MSRSGSSIGIIRSIVLTSDNSLRPVSAGSARAAGAIVDALAGADTGAGTAGKDGARMTDAGLVDVATIALAGVDPTPGCGMPMRSNTRAAPATAPMATPAASLRRGALAHPGHEGMRACAHGTIRASTSRRKPATALTCHPSSGHVGGSSQRSAAGRSTLGGTRLGTARERIHCAGAGIRTAGATDRRRADEPPDFQRAGAIR